MADDERREAGRVLKAAIDTFFDGQRRSGWGGWGSRASIDVIDAARVRWQNEALEEAAKDFDETMHELWHNYEVADRLRDLKKE